MTLQIKSHLIALTSFLIAVSIFVGCKKQPANSTPNAKQEQEVTKQTLEAEVKKPLDKSNIPSNENKGKEENKEVVNNDKVDAELPVRLLVSFYSIGGGIDIKSAESFDRFILAYKTSEGKSVSYERVPWGREGELDYCILFDGMSNSNIKGFIEAAKAKVSDCKMVHFKPDGECKRKR